MNKLLIFSILLCLSCAGFSQDKEDVVLLVLSKSVIGQIFTFNLSDKKDYINEAAITYLGEIETKTKEKILHSYMG